MSLRAIIFEDRYSVVFLIPGEVFDSKSTGRTSWAAPFWKWTSLPKAV